MSSFLKKNIGWITILILALFPIARWALIMPLGFRFADFSRTMTSFGQIAGLVGMALFSINLVLSARLKIFDEYFYGINNLYAHHYKIGAVSFSLLLFHPLFLVARYVQISLRSAALFFLPFGNSAVTFGQIALLGMIVLLALTFYAKLKYQNWKISHKFLTIAFVFAMLHSFFITSDISRDFILRYYILVLALLGLISGFYRAFLSGFLNRNFQYRIIRITQLNQEVVELEMAPENKKMEFRPGQFAFVKFLNKETGKEVHPFSICSSPEEKNLRFTIKSLGDFTSGLMKLNINDSVLLEGPFGKFSYKNILNKNQIWIAGGIGITPFLSMARTLEEKDGCKITLFYCVKDKDEAIFSNELLKISLADKNFRFFSWYSEEKGFIKCQNISELSGGLGGKDILLCGPADFMKILRKQFIKLNVPGKKIHWEMFQLV